MVGATTLIFSIIQLLNGKFGAENVFKGLSIINPLFLLGLNPRGIQYIGQQRPF